MNRTRTWIVAGATVAVAGFGSAVALASDDVQLNDRAPAPVVEMSSDQGGDPAQFRTQPPADASPESADSPAESPMDSADSPHDSAGDASADSP